MFQYRQVLVRLRAGDTVREIARTGLMGRDKLGALASGKLSERAGRRLKLVSGGVMLALGTVIVLRLQWIL